MGVLCTSEKPLRHRITSKNLERSVLRTFLRLSFCLSWSECRKFKTIQRSSRYEKSSFRRLKICIRNSLSSIRKETRSLIWWICLKKSDLITLRDSLITEKVKQIFLSRETSQTRCGTHGPVRRHRKLNRTRNMLPSLQYVIRRSIRVDH